MKRIGNPILDGTRLGLKHASKSAEAKVWLDASRYLSKTRSHKPCVNLGKIERMSKKDAVVLVPGKVLGGGVLTHRVIVGAYSFTETAKIKIARAGGEALTIPELLKRHPSGGGVMLIGG
jgi:large subunit ribosomal protein L18e